MIRVKKRRQIERIYWLITCYWRLQQMDIYRKWYNIFFSLSYIRVRQIQQGAKKIKNIRKSFSNRRRKFLRFFYLSFHAIFVCCTMYWFSSLAFSLHYKKDVILENKKQTFFRNFFYNSFHHQWMHGVLLISRKLLVR